MSDTMYRFEVNAAARNAPHAKEIIKRLENTPGVLDAHYWGFGAPQVLVGSATVDDVEGGFVRASRAITSVLDCSWCDFRWYEEERALHVYTHTPSQQGLPLPAGAHLIATLRGLQMYVAPIVDEWRIYVQVAPTENAYAVYGDNYCTRDECVKQMVLGIALGTRGTDLSSGAVLLWHNEAAEAAFNEASRDPR